jgi:hypothetical protein
MGLEPVACAWLRDALARMDLYHAWIHKWDTRESHKDP